MKILLLDDCPITETENYRSDVFAVLPNLYGTDGKTRDGQDIAEGSEGESEDESEEEVAEGVLAKQPVQIYSSEEEEDKNIEGDIYKEMQRQIIEGPNVIEAVAGELQPEFMPIYADNSEEDGVFEPVGALKRGPPLPVEVVQERYYLSDENAEEYSESEDDGK